MRRLVALTIGLLTGCHHRPPAQTIVVDPALPASTVADAHGAYAAWWSCVTRKPDAPASYAVLQIVGVQGAGWHTVQGQRILLDAAPWRTYSPERRHAVLVHELGHFYGLIDCPNGTPEPSIMSWKNTVHVATRTAYDCKLFCSRWRCD